MKETVRQSKKYKRLDEKWMVVGIYSSIYNSIHLRNQLSQTNIKTIEIQKRAEEKIHKSEQSIFSYFCKLAKHN